MEQAIAALSLTPDEILIDGRDVPKGLKFYTSLSLEGRGCPNGAGEGVNLNVSEASILDSSALPQNDTHPHPSAALTPSPLKGEGSNVHAIIGGDALHPCISAASIIAKVMRDRAMRVMDTQYPHYGFAKHKGYGTALHANALKIHGACDIHRKSFAPIRAVLTA
jgi:ribonuclease HII